MNYNVLHTNMKDFKDDSENKLKVRQGTGWYEYLLSTEKVLKMKLWLKKMKKKEITPPERQLFLPNNWPNETICLEVWLQFLVRGITDVDFILKK